MLSAICAYAGLYHLLFFFRRKNDRINLLFSFLCFAYTPYFIAQAEWYSSTTIIHAFRSIQAGYGSLSFVMIFEILFFYYFTKKSFSKYIIHISTGVFGIFAVLSFINSGVTLSPSTAFSKTLTFAHLYEYTVYEFTAGIFIQLFFVLIIAVMIFLAYSTIRYYKKQYGTILKPMTFALAIGLLAAVHDTLSVSGVSNSVTLGEFSYMFLILAMTYRLKNNYMDEHEEAERLNEILDTKVEERTKELNKKNIALEEAIEKVQILSGFLPICANCKKIRDDKGYWNQIEHYISTHSDVIFSHAICPECMHELYPEIESEPLSEDD
jgi:hypothetical protein